MSNFPLLDADSRGAAPILWGRPACPAPNLSKPPPLPAIEIEFEPGIFELQDPVELLITEITPEETGCTGAPVEPRRGYSGVGIQPALGWRVMGFEKDWGWRVAGGTCPP